MDDQESNDDFVRASNDDCEVNMQEYQEEVTNQDFQSTFRSPSNPFGIASQS